MYILSLYKSFLTKKRVKVPCCFKDKFQPMNPTLENPHILRVKEEYRPLLDKEKERADTIKHLWELRGETGSGSSWGLFTCLVWADSLAGRPPLAPPHPVKLVLSRHHHWLTADIREEGGETAGGFLDTAGTHQSSQYSFMTNRVKLFHLF